MTKRDNVWVVIPAYNEEEALGKVIDSLRGENFKNILVVNDGSTDSTEEIAKKKKVRVYTHVINRGLGGALSTGLTAALMNGAEIIVTCDGDGQHDAKDVRRAVDFLEKEEADVVIGSRLIDSEGMPFLRKLGNKGFNLITYILFGIYSTDTQSGLRVFSKKAAEKIKIRGSRMEVSSEIIKEIKRNGLLFKEIPIKAIYSDYSLEKGQKNINGFNILYKLILGRAMK